MAGFLRSRNQRATLPWIGVLFFAALLQLESTYAGQEGPPCPSITRPQAIEDWKRNLLAQFADWEEDKLLTAIRQCFKGAVPACLAPLQALGHSQDEPPQSFMTQNPPPTEQDFPVEFQVKDSDGKLIPGQIHIPENILQLAKERGWKYTSGRTRAGGGFGGSGNITLFQITGPKKDFFVQVNLPYGGNQQSPALEKDILDGFQDDSVQEVAFAMVDKTKTPKVGTLWNMDHADGGNRFKFQAEPGVTCRSCHVNPLKAYSLVGYHGAHERESRMSKEQEKATEEINQAMASYGPLSWGNYLDEKGKEKPLLPNQGLFPVGWTPKNAPTRTASGILSCAKGSELSDSDPQRGVVISGNGGFTGIATIHSPKAIRPEAVLSAMTCTDCHHDGGLLNPLTVSDDNILRRMVFDHGMPPGLTDITDDERIAAYNCLMKEREAFRNEWYARIPCGKNLVLKPMKKPDINDVIRRVSHETVPRPEPTHRIYDGRMPPARPSESPAQRDLGRPDHEAEPASP